MSDGALRARALIQHPLGEERPAAGDFFMGEHQFGFRLGKLLHGDFDIGAANPFAQRMHIIKIFRDDIGRAAFENFKAVGTDFSLQRLAAAACRLEIAEIVAIALDRHLIDIVIFAHD